MRRRRRSSQPTMLLAVIVLCLTPAPTYASFQLDLVNVTFFQREPEASFFKPKQNGVLFCEHSTSLLAQVAWYRNGTRMDWKLAEVRDKFEERRRANGSELVFKQFMPTTHGGYYQCLLTIASVGSILSRPALVQLATVEMSSRGHRKENITVQAGNMALIPCDSPFDVSIPRTEVAFELNGTALQLRSDKHLITSDGKLLVMQVKQTDAGNYQCVLTNREASVSQRSNVEYSLIVPSLKRVTPALLYKSPPLVHAYVGDNVTIMCVYMANPVPEVEWELPNAAGVPTDSRLLSPNDRITVETKGYLHIANVGFDDAGVYRCKYSYERGSKTDTFTLQVDGPPSVTISTSKLLHAAKGITLRCDITRSTNSFWLRNGERLNVRDESIRVSTTTKRSGDEMRLTILQVSQEHQGVYQCFAENQFGTSVRSVRLEVNAPDPSSRMAPETVTNSPSRRRANLIRAVRDNQTCNRGEAVVFSCEAFPMTGLEFRWLFNGSLLQSDPNNMELIDGSDGQMSTLILSALTRNFSGMFTCVVQTRVAFDEASVYLTVLGDTAPVETSAESLTSTTVSPKPRKLAKTSSPQPLPTQLNARLSGRAVMLTWTLPSEVALNATDAFEVQYCRDCRLKNAQPGIRAGWRTLNETVDLLARRHMLRGLSPATYVFRMQVRFVDGTTRITDTSPPITVTAESVSTAGSVSAEEVDNPFSDLRVECVSERNCSVVWARWSYAPKSRLLREDWDGVAILVADTERSMTSRKLMISGLSTTAYQVGVEPNRQLEFSVSLVRSGERSPGRSATINTYPDEEGLLNVLELEAMLPYTTAQPYVEVPVEAFELADEIDQSEAANGSLAGEEIPPTVARSLVLDRLYIVFAAAGAIVTAMLLISIVTCILRTKLRQQPHKQTKYMATSTYSTDAAASHKPLHTDASGFAESEATAYDYEPLPVSHVAYASASFGLSAPLNISPARQPIEIEPARSGSTTVSHQSQADDGAQLLSFNTSNLTSTSTCDNTSRSSSANADSTVRVDMSRFKQRTHALADGATPPQGTAIPVSVPVVHKFGTLPLKSARSARSNVTNADGKVATTPTGNNAHATFGLPPFVPPSTTDLGCLAAPTNTPPVDPWQRLADPHSQSLVRLHEDATATLPEPEYAQPCFVVPQKTHTQRCHSPHRSKSRSSSNSRSGGSPCNCPQCCDCADCRQPSRMFDAEQPLVSVLSHGNTVSAAVPMPLTFALPPPPPLPAADDDDASPTRRNKKTLRSKKSDCGVQDDNPVPADRQNVRRTRTLRDDESRRGRSRSRDARTDRSRSRQRPRAAAAPNTSDSSSTGRSRAALDPTLVVMLNRKDAPVSSLALADNARQTVI